MARVDSNSVRWRVVKSTALGMESVEDVSPGHIAEDIWGSFAIELAQIHPVSTCVHTTCAHRRRKGNSRRPATFSKSHQTQFSYRWIEAESKVCFVNCFLFCVPFLLRHLEMNCRLLKVSSQLRPRVVPLTFWQVAHVHHSHSSSPCSACNLIIILANPAIFVCSSGPIEWAQRLNALPLRKWKA